ncbi:MAG: ABC transporter ATP-binding protein [Tissierellia bacterium]|nr:ABC transporter ATP-binding protein [Tissierellia bacterium]
MLKMLEELMSMMEIKKKQIILSMFFTFIDGFLLAVPMIISYYIMKAIYTDKNHSLDLTLIKRYAIIMILCIITRVILRYFTLKLRSSAGYESICLERKKLGQDLKDISMGYFNKDSLGNLVTTITSDAGFIEIEGMGIVEKMAIGIPSLIIGILLIISINRIIGIITISLFIPIYLLYKILANIQYKYNLDRQREIGVFNEDVIEFIQGLHILKIYNMTDKHFYRIKNAFSKLKEFSLKIEFAHIPNAAVYQLGFRIISLSIIFFSAYFAIYGKMDFGTAFLLMLIGTNIFSGIEMMGIYSIFSKMTRSSMARINKIRDIPKLEDRGNIREITNWDIEFNDISFAYETRMILKDISFRVPQNTTTALVGLSGSGKTTITNLVARFWDVQKGKIKIGGIDIKDIKYEILLQNMSFVFQDVFLFDDSVINNIRLARPDAELEEVIEAAKKARCHDFIMEMEDGYQTMIGESGNRLSGGEKQRISIARALIKNAPIVLLDEVTANVDLENEMHIQMGLQELLKDKTVIMIAHKLTTIKDVENIIVLEGGRIIEEGNHSKLIDMSGRYKKLWDLQFEACNWEL